MCTYSIVAYSPDEKLLGVGVASGSIAVGNRVPWAKYPYGAIATQAYTNPSLGPLIIDLLKRGYSAVQALEEALKQDPSPSKRQVAVIDTRLGKAVYNGTDIPEYSGSYSGEYSVCIANLVVTPDLPRIMCNVFEEKLVEKGLVEAILTALSRAEEIGGDRRGDRSAALLVVGETQYGELYDKIIDLRIDHDPEQKPVEKLVKVYRKTM